jgi:hypothetical protein
LDRSILEFAHTYAAWLAWASRSRPIPSRLKPFVKLARTIPKYKDGILAGVTLENLEAPLDAIAGSAGERSPAGPMPGSGRDPIQLVERVAQPLARGTLGAVWPYLLVVVTDKAGACAALGLWAGCGSAYCAAGSGSQLAESARGHRAGTLGIPSRTCSSASGSPTLTSTAYAGASLRLRDVHGIREHS